MKKGKISMDKLCMKAKVSYSFGDAACCLMNYMIGYYLSFYCSVIMGIPLIAVGTIILIVQCWDAVNDIIVGLAVDRTRTKQGKARPWIKWFMLPCCLSGALIYACPQTMSLNGKIMWVSISYFLFALFYTCINLPYGSMLSLMTKNQKERTTLCTSRYVGAYAGLLIVSAGALPLVNFIDRFSGENNGYKWVMILFCLASSVLLYFLYRNCHEADEDQYVPDKDFLQKWSAPKQKQKAGFKILFQNKAWMVALCVSFIYWFKYPFYGATMTYFYKFYLGIDEAASSVMYTAGVIAGIAILPLVTKVTVKWDYKKPLAASCLISALSMMTGFFCKRNLLLAIGAFAVNYAAETFPCAVTLSMIADSLEYSELKSGRKLDGLGFAMNSFCSKVGLGLGSFFAPVILKLGKLNIVENEATLQPESALLTIRLVFWVIPAVLSLAMILFIAKYPLDRLTYLKISQKLTEVRHQRKRNN